MHSYHTQEIAEYGGYRKEKVPPTSFNNIPFWFYDGQIIQIPSQADMQQQMLEEVKIRVSKFLEDTIQQKNITNVHIVGYMPHEEIIDFYFRADVFVAPSVVEEALGLSILEAMASKTPVIATRKGGIPLLVKHNQNGLFVKPRNAKQIAEACNKLLDNDELRQRMGENAKKTVEEKFTWKKIGLQFDKLYRKYGNGNGKK